MSKVNHPVTFLSHIIPDSISLRLLITYNSEFVKKKQMKDDDWKTPRNMKGQKRY